MAIYTRYGMRVTLIGQVDSEGWVHVRYEDGTERERHVSELRPDAESMGEYIAALGENG